MPDYSRNKTLHFMMKEMKSPSSIQVTDRQFLNGGLPRIHCSYMHLEDLVLSDG